MPLLSWQGWIWVSVCYLEKFPLGSFWCVLGKQERSESWSEIGVPRHLTMLGSVERTEPRLADFRLRFCVDLRSSSEAKSSGKWLTNCGNKNIEISAVCFRSWLSHGCKLCKDGLFDILVGVSLDSYMLPNLLTFLRNHLVISPKSLNNENHWIWFNHKLPPAP